MEFLKGLLRKKTQKPPEISSETTEELTKEELRKKWGSLSYDAKGLLIAGLHFSAEIGGTREAWAATSGLDDEKFAKAEHQLLEQGLLGIGLPQGHKEKLTNDDLHRRHLEPDIMRYLKKDILKID